MVKTLKRTSKKSHRTLLHRRKINNKLRSKKNGLSKRYSKKAVLKQKGGGDAPIKVYIVYKKGNKKSADSADSADSNDREFTTLPKIYANKLEFVKQMSKLDVGNIIGILYQKGENDWVFCGLNFCYVDVFTRVVDEKTYTSLSSSNIPPIKKTLETDEVDNTEYIKKAITELCGSENFPEGFFTQMKKHDKYSCCIRLQKKGLFRKLTGNSQETHNLTSLGYSREDDTTKKIYEDRRGDDDFSPLRERTVNNPGKETISEKSISIKPVKKTGIKMIVVSSEDISVADGDILFMPYVNNGDYYSDEMGKSVMNKNYQSIPLSGDLYEPTIIEFPGRPLMDRGKIDYSTRGSILPSNKFDFSKTFDGNIIRDMLGKLKEFCDFIIGSKAIEQKTAYVKKKWPINKNMVSTYEYGDLLDVYGIEELKQKFKENFKVDEFTEAKFKEIKDGILAEWNRPIGR